MIYTGAMWRELRDFFIFEDVGKLGVFEGDRGRSSGCNSRYGFERDVVRGEVGIEVNRGGESFLVASNVGNREKKEFVVLRVDLMGRKDSRETTFRLGIRRTGRIWWNRRLIRRMKGRSWS